MGVTLEVLFTPIEATVFETGLKLQLSHLQANTRVLPQKEDRGVGKPGLPPSIPLQSLTTIYRKWPACPNSWLACSPCICSRDASKGFVCEGPL